MNGWQTIPGERLMLYSPIGLRLVDDFTGTRPFGPIQADLEEQDSNGDWHATAVSAVRTPGDVLGYPGLGRSANQAAQPVRRYRVLLSAAWYRADYLINLDAIEFDVHPYDDQNPPALFPAQPNDVFLLPSFNYPFPRHIRVLRGVVEDAANNPVANVEVTEGPRERVLTDSRGAFSIPLRWPALNAAVQIDALDHRTGRSGQININLPGDLAQGHTITIN
jgi:hypothetical protein